MLKKYWFLIESNKPKCSNLLNVINQTKTRVNTLEFKCITWTAQLVGILKRGGGVNRFSYAWFQVAGWTASLKHFKFAGISDLSIFYFYCHHCVPEPVKVFCFLFSFFFHDFSGTKARTPKKPTSTHTCSPSRPLFTPSHWYLMVHSIQFGS